MSEYLLRMEHISKTFHGMKALDHVRLEVKRGEIHALIGENGAGKSTLIKILAGVYQPDFGAEFYFEGKKVEIKKPIDAVLKGISIIYQDLSLFPNLSVAENICIGKDVYNKSWKRVNWNEIKKIAQKVLNELDFQIDLYTPVEKLSIAQQQLIEIARALAFDSKLIVMDEPTASLSSSEVEKLYHIIDRLKQKGISVIFVSHKLKELFTVSDRFTVLRDGKYVGTYLKEEMDEEKLITLMVGRKVQYERSQAVNHKIGNVILEVRNLSKEGNFKDISFQLKEGEVLGITGLVGSGRTELAQAIFGVNNPYKGEVKIQGEAVFISSPEKAVKNGIAYIPENRKIQGLILEQSVINNISISILKALRTKLGLIQRKKEVDLAERYIQAIDIRPAAPERKVGQLSGGNQQKVVISKWLATNPKILIIDEPTSGIDIGAKTEIHKLLRQLASEGMGVIVISSELPEILAVSDRILVMKHGRIAGELNIQEATQENIMNLALLGASPANHHGALSTVTQPSKGAMM
ncbi:ABC transporter [Anoxybacillus sp. UARK-01]|uniref:sugar ABC transporter ATP-binding protein n=1 Tax=Anoxybacillaceae TaxID=3120669 RepID=UPI0009BB59E2|nr:MULTISPECIES: sugar ABC transporter ATP-binding protein [Anoxybacillus]MBB3908539.1 ABC-type sugar transport system ATPase subunit [Anoxybacillus rupiensis]OQM44691.1 ABC transporter [Anoxybacillus sp. UARK-01]